MSVLQWDKAGEKEFELGTDHGVLYPAVDDNSTQEELGLYEDGVAWNGLVSVSESPEGGEPTEIYADNLVYGVLVNPEKLKLTVEHFSAPLEFYPCDGCTMEGGVLITNQPRKAFGFSFRSRVGNDLDQNAGYKLHIVYGCRAGVAEKGYKTIGDTPEVITFSRPITTLPVTLADGRTTAELIIDSRTADPAGLADLEATLYGTSETPPELPSPDEVLGMVLLAYVTPATSSVVKGATQQFECVDFNGDDIECVWAVDSEVAGTTITSDGLLTVAADETDDTLVVTATPLKSYISAKTASVTVTTE